MISGKSMIIKMRQEEGMVLPLVLLIMIVAIIMGVTVMYSSRIETRIAGNERRAKQDFYVAESAGEYVIEDFDAFASSTVIEMNTTYNLSSRLPAPSMIDHANTSLRLTREGPAPVGSGTSVTHIMAKYYRVNSTQNGQSVEVGVWKGFPIE